MKRRAYNKVIFQGRTYVQAIVERSDNGDVLQVYEFTDEQPFTEWIGGELDLDRETSLN